MCFVDLENAFERVPRRAIQWALRTKGLPEILVKALMSLYEGSKTKVKVGSDFSVKFDLAVGVHQGSVLSPLLNCGRCCDRECKRRLNERGFVRR